MLGTYTNMVRYMVKQLHVLWTKLTEFTESNIYAGMTFTKFIVGFSQ